MATQDFARCPLCAAVVEISNELWRKIWPFGSAFVLCMHCHRQVAIRDAKMMGASFSHWSRQFQTLLAHTVRDLPILPTGDALSALASHLKLDDAKPIAGLQSLLQHACSHYRQVIKEQAQGRQAELEVVVVASHDHTPRCVGIIGRRGAESGDSSGSEMFISRVATEEFMIYTPQTSTGRIIHATRVRPADGGPAMLVAD